MPFTSRRVRGALALLLVLSMTVPPAGALLAPPGADGGLLLRPEDPPPAAKTDADVMAQAARDVAEAAPGPRKAEPAAEAAPGDGAAVPAPGAPEGPGPAYACPASTAPEVLASGVTVPGTATATADCHYKFVISGSDTTKRLRIELTALGDHDLFAKLGTPATVSPYECSGTGTNATFEVCVVYPVIDGETFIRVKRFASQDYNITAHYEDAPQSCNLGQGITSLANNTGVAGNLTTEGTASCFFSFAASATSGNMAQWVLNLTTTNYDLFVRRGGLPTNTTYDCRPLSSGTTNETCGADLFSDATFFGMVRRGSSTSGSGNFTVKAAAIPSCSLGNGILALAHGTPVTGSLTTDAAARCYFSFAPDAAAGDVARFTLNLTTQNYDLYVRKGAVPTDAAYDCRPLSSGTTNETCAVDLADGTPVYAKVQRASGATGSANFTVRAENVSTCGLGPAIQELVPGVPVQGSLTADTGAKCLFRIDHLASAADLLRFRLPATTPADFDLYVRKGALPNTTAYDCRPFLGSTSDEVCDIDVTGDGTWFAMVRRFSGSGSFNLTATPMNTCSLGPLATALTSGATVAGSLSGAVNGKCAFSFTVPAAVADFARISMAGPANSSDFDLYVKRGAMPNLTSYDCRPFLAANVTETCEFSVAADTTFFAMVRRASGGGGFNITATSLSTCSLGPGTTALEDGVPAAASLGDATGAACQFSFQPSPEADLARFVMAPPAGSDFDLHVRKGSPPTTTAFDCRPALGAGVQETCEPLADGTTFFVMVRRVTGSGDLTLTATSASTCSRGPGTHALPDGVTTEAALTGDEGAQCVFSFSPSPATADLAKFTLEPPAGADFDLYVRKGAIPTLTAFDCRPALGPGEGESCDVDVTDATPLFVTVRRVAGSGDFSLSSSSAATCSLGVGAHGLEHGTPRTASLTSNAGAKCYFSFTPDPVAGDGGRFALTPGEGSDFDLYVRKGALPTTTAYDCRPLLGGDAAETCELEVADATPFFVMARRSSGSGEFTLSGDDFATCSLGVGTIALADGVAVAPSLTGNSWAKCRFSFVPDPAAFDGGRFTMAPGAGNDFDLHVRKGSPPTTTSYDCRPFLGTGATETCELEVADATPFFVLVRRAGGSGAMSMAAANFATCSLGAGIVALTHAQSVQPSLTANSWAKCRFSMAGNAATDDGIRFRMSPPAGVDFDLYVRKGSAPTTTSYDCRPFLGSGAAELCEREVTDDTLFHVLVRRAAGSGAFTMLGERFSTCSLGAAVHELVDTATVSPALTPHAWAKCSFRLAVTPEADFARFVMAPRNGSAFDPDLYVRKGAMPTTSLWDCRPFSGGNATETCDMLLTDLQPYFVMVRRFSGSGPFDLTGSNVVIPRLDQLRPVVGFAEAGRFQYWKVVLPPNASALSIAIAGDPTEAACDASQACAPMGEVRALLCPEPAETCQAQQGLRDAACPAAPAACGTVRGTDADLFVRFAAGLPTTSLWSCRSATKGSVESCTFSTLLNTTAGDPLGPPVSVRPGVAPGKYFIGVRGALGEGRYVIAAAWAAGPVAPPHGPAEVQPFAGRVCADAAVLPGSNTAAFYGGLFCRFVHAAPGAPSGPSAAGTFAAALCAAAAGNLVPYDGPRAQLLQACAGLPGMVPQAPAPPAPPQAPAPPIVPPALPAVPPLPP